MDLLSQLVFKNFRSYDELCRHNGAVNCMCITQKLNSMQVERTSSTHLVCNLTASRLQPHILQSTRITDHIATALINICSNTPESCQWKLL